MPRGNREVAIKNLEKATIMKKQYARQRKVERARELLAEEDAKNAQQMTDEEKMDSNTKKQLAKDMIDGRDGETIEESSEEEVEHDFADLIAQRVAGMKIKSKQKKPKKKVVKKKPEPEERENSESEIEESEQEEPKPKKGRGRAPVNVNVYNQQPEKPVKENNVNDKIFLKF